MKKLIMIAALLTISNVFAESEKNKSGQGEKPCLEVKKACEAAGFEKGKHKEGKGLYLDCIKKLANGESVAGVSVSADVIASCKQRQDKHQEHKNKKEQK